MYVDSSKRIVKWGIPALIPNIRTVNPPYSKMLFVFISQAHPHLCRPISFVLYIVHSTVYTISPYVCGYFTLRAAN